jgi:sulfur-oxidizing protein SoxX
MRRRLAARAAAALAAGVAGVIAGGGDSGRAQQAMAEFEVVGDAIPRSLTGTPGDAERGRAIVLGPARGNCTICHAVPAPDERYHGDLGPSLRSVARRASEGQLRLRMVDGSRLDARSIMPAYHRLDGFRRVAAAYAGKPVLTAVEIEDVVAYLLTLRD